ncbi:MAG: translation initiation factor IF-2 N-terminal domain-containing protein, partial [Pseudomonadota bacterium]
MWQGRPGVPMSDWKAQQLRRARQFVPRSTPRTADAARATPGMRRPSGPRQGAFGASSTPRQGAFGRSSTRRGTKAAEARRRQRPTQDARAALAPSTAERAAHKRVLKIHEAIGVASLADALGVKAHAVLAKLLALGAQGLHINSTLDFDTAALVAAEFGWTVENVAVTETELIRRARPEESVTGTMRRAPVVTVMGHVDHGKTSLLDRIRHTSVAAAEAGGITQHIGAYVAEIPGGRLTFIDTPGHEAFTALRARGAAVTDLVVLVVAADDGIMPQTREAVDHARAAGVPLVVAINKVDRPDADPARVRRQLTEIGLVPEELGGDVLVAEVSAATGQGVPELLEKGLLQAELLP